jgi:hypothetical protein
MPCSVPPATSLLPRQTRVIHASAGIRPRVVSGCLWLIRPDAAREVFLDPGDDVDLLQDREVIGANVQPDGGTVREGGRTARTWCSHWRPVRLLQLGRAGRRVRLCAGSGGLCSCDWAAGAALARAELSKPAESRGWRTRCRPALRSSDGDPQGP